MVRFSLHQTAKEFLAFIKATVHTTIISITCAPFNLIDWLIFEDEQI